MRRVVAPVFAQRFAWSGRWCLPRSSGAARAFRDGTDCVPRSLSRFLLGWLSSGCAEVRS